MKEAFLLKVYQKRTQKSTGSLLLILSVNIRNLQTKP